MHDPDALAPTPGHTQPTRTAAVPVGRRQRGAITVLMALVSLLIITGATLMHAELAVNEQRNAANVERQKQAFEAAMAGYDYAMAYLQQNGPDADGNATADALVAPAAARADRTALATGATYAVELCAPDIDALPSDPTSACSAPTGAGNLRRLLIWARGWSDDDTGVSQIVSTAARTPAMANTPRNPLTTKGTAVINGSGDVTNPESRTTIWSGQSVSFTNANFKTNIPSPHDPDTLVESSSQNKRGFDVIDNDGNLGTLTGDAFFANFFGTTPAVYRDTYATRVLDASDAGDMATLDGSTGEIIWLEGNASINGGTVGSAAAPALLVVNGDLTSNGNVTVNGVLYVVGDADLGGNATVNGSLVVQGTSDVTGSLDVVFSSQLTSLAGTATGGFAAAAGTWKDWR